MGSFLMLLAVLMKWAGILQMQLFQINQSEESSKITINAHTTSCPLHELPITAGLLYINLEVQENEIKAMFRIPNWISFQTWFWKYEITKPQMSRCHIIVSRVSQFRGGAILSTVSRVSIYSIQYLQYLQYTVSRAEVGWEVLQDLIVRIVCFCLTPPPVSRGSHSHAGMVQGWWKYSDM